MIMSRSTRQKLFLLISDISRNLSLWFYEFEIELEICIFILLSITFFNLSGWIIMSVKYGIYYDLICLLRHALLMEIAKWIHITYTHAISNDYNFTALVKMTLHNKTRPFYICLIKCSFLTAEWGSVLLMTNLCLMTQSNLFMQYRKYV